MANFDTLYKQTITLFNRLTVDDVVVWYPFVIPNVHLVVDKSIVIASYGEQSQDNARLNIRYTVSGKDAVINGKTYMMPKEWARNANPLQNFTFGFGDAFDFFVEGDYGSTEVISDDAYRNGFYNYMNRTRDNVFAISTVSKFNLIPHFEIGAR